MPKKMTTAAARREWAKVLRLAERGTVVQVTRNGQPVAAVVSIATYRAIEQRPAATLPEVISAFRERVDPADLAGPDPWEDVRDREPGRDVDFV
jgi:prevent-host-death family protein